MLRYPNRHPGITLEIYRRLYLSTHSTLKSTRSILHSALGRPPANNLPLLSKNTQLGRHAEPTVGSLDVVFEQNTQITNTSESALFYRIHWQIPWQLKQQLKHHFRIGKILLDEIAMIVRKTFHFRDNIKFIFQVYINWMVFEFFKKEPKQRCLSFKFNGE